MSEPSAPLRVQDIGEQGLLQRLYPFCPPELVGDDAAVLAIAPGHDLVVTTDMLVDGVHFSAGIATPDVYTTSAADVGWRAVAANLSDLAAMGADPVGITISLGLPGELEVAWVEQLYCGISECLQPSHTPIAGGDVCRSPVITVSITALGHVASGKAILRSTAQPGDAIVVTGRHGLSLAGLELLLNSDAGANLEPGDRADFIRAHQRPRPRLDVIAVLRAMGAFDDTPVRIAGMDSSDGLADAIVQICGASGVGARLEWNQIPMSQALTCWITPNTAMEWALYGGEDFELVLCLPPNQAELLVDRLETPAAIIGTITSNAAESEPNIVLTDSTGTVPTQVLSLSQGFQHF
ncbi:MAG TPA: thiamine-phosphate kinase [Elainellaceae cyanobacterium]